MTNEEIIKMIRNHRGLIMAGILAKDSIVYVEVTKQALYTMISGYHKISDRLTFEIIQDFTGHEGVLYVDNQRD